MLLVSNPHLPAVTIPAAVQTTQIAPTILKVLGIDPNRLRAVQIEQTPVLPGFDLD